jgi:hypothetical protein
MPAIPDSNRGDRPARKLAPSSNPQLCPNCVSSEPEACSKRLSGAFIVKKLKTFLHKSSQFNQNSDQPIDFPVDFVLTMRT